MILYRRNRVAVSLRIACPTSNGSYQFVSGHGEPGESPVETGVREVREETGLSLDPSRLRFMAAYPVFKRGVVQYQAYRYCVSLGEKEEPRCAEPEKHGPWEWRSIAELYLLPLPPRSLEFASKASSLLE